MSAAYRPDDHTFAICAYGESPYLEACIRSVLSQKTKTGVLIATSTPNAHIAGLAETYGIPLFVNEKALRRKAGKHRERTVGGGEISADSAISGGPSARGGNTPVGNGIATDWNFAYACAKTRLVTITHQDDIYLPAYARETLGALNRARHPLIAFTDYGELRHEAGEAPFFSRTNKLLNIKRLMLLPLRFGPFRSSVFVRRRILSFGSAICCPSVTYVKEHLPKRLFREGYRSDLDWEVWEKLSKHRGDFVYCPKLLMAHRIHRESATTAIIADKGRTREDFEMYCKFWPVPVARLLEHFYREGERQNG